MSIVVSKETVHRLLKDVKQIMNNPLTDNNIYYHHDEEDMLKGYAMIIGTEDTPYFGGFYFFEIMYPPDYPHSPPNVKYCTNGDNIRFNPNLYVNGKVCISLLNTWSGEQWTSCQTISSVLLTIGTLLCSYPLLNEPGVSRRHIDFVPYTKIIEYKNIEIAILYMISKKPSFFPEQFEMFTPFMKESFIKTSPKIEQFLKKKSILQLQYLNEIPEKLTTSYYSLSVSTDYIHLAKKYTDYLATLSA